MLGRDEHDSQALATTGVGGGEKGGGGSWAERVSMKKWVSSPVDVEAT